MISDAYNAITGISLEKGLLAGGMLYGGLTGAGVTASLVVPFSLFVLAMGINGRTGKLIDGVAPTVIGYSVLAITAGGCIGALALPTLLKVVEVSANALN